MKNLDGIIEKIDKHINEKDKIREQALRSSRDIIIGCRKAIQFLHRDLKKDAKSYIKQASDKLADLYDLTGKYPDLFHAGYVENASQELVEAHCLYNIMLGKELPDPDTIQTTYSSYLLGLCDVVGELRRGALDFILEGEASKANEYLNHMDKIYDAIMSLDYPSGLIPIKRKQDIVRGLIEKTRGELAVASCERRIDDRTHEFRGLLDKINGKKKVKEKKKDTMDIDIDKVW
ncbi:MAG: RNA-binding protein [Thermoplasmatales archaeon]|nr:MAG: RNA-binding protein [Thermoplasmatales archaeon]